MLMNASLTGRYGIADLCPLVWRPVVFTNRGANFSLCMTARLFTEVFRFAGSGIFLFLLTGCRKGSI